MLQHWVSNPLPKKKEFYTIWNNLLIKLTEPKSKMSQYIHKSFSKYIQIKFMYQNIPVRLNDSVGQKVSYRKLLLGLTLAYVLQRESTCDVPPLALKPKVRNCISLSAKSEN